MTPGAAADEGEDEAVPLQERAGGDLPVADLVVRRRIGPGEVEHELGVERPEDRWQVGADRREIGLVRHAVPQLDGGRAFRHGSRGVVVDREGVHGGIVPEKGPRAVAVVEVEVHHQDAGAEAPGAQVGHGRRHVVVGAEALSPVREGVVEAAAQVDGDALAVEGQAGGGHGAAGHGALGFEEPVGGVLGEPVADDAGQSLGPVEGVEVVVGVDPAQVPEGGGLGGVDVRVVEQPGGVQGRQDALPALGVVVPAGDLQLVAPAVDELDARTPAHSEDTAPPSPEGRGQPGQEGAHGLRTGAGGPRWRPSRPLPGGRRRRLRPACRAPGACAPSGAGRRSPCRG